jgi:hypothetical protein
VTVLLAPEAEEDLRCLVEYLRDRNPIAAAQLLDRDFTDRRQPSRLDIE